MKFLVIDNAGLFWDAVSLYLHKVEPKAMLNFAAQVDQACDILRREGGYSLILVNPSLLSDTPMAQLSRILDVAGSAKLGIISEPLPKDFVQQVIRRGVSGYFPKTMRAESFVQAMRFVLSGEVFMPVETRWGQYYTGTSGNSAVHEAQAAWGEVADYQKHEAGLSTQELAELSRREMQVLQVLADGCSNKDIARKLDIQEVTVKQHVRSVMRKLDVSNRVQLARIAWAVKSM